MAAKKGKGWRSGRREGRSRMVQMTRHLVVSEGKETEPRYFEDVRAALGAANGRKVAIVVKGTGKHTLDLLDFAVEHCRYAPETFDHVWLVFDKDAKYDLKTQAVGSGPYTVAKFVENSSITLKANEKYWGKNKAKTPTVVVKYLADDNAAVNALKSGDVQVLAPITENLAEPFKSDSAKYTVKAGNGTDKFVLGFNNASGSKLADKRIRQAIRYAINHKELIASRGGADKALGGPIPSLDPGYEDLTNLYPYDQNKAKSLMAEAGYSTDKPLQLTLTYANIYGTELGDQLRSQLKPIGIDLKVNVVEFSTWLQDVYTNHTFDISLVDHNESHDFASWTDPTYYFGYDNKNVTKLYNEGVAATSDKERDAKFAAAAKLVSEDAPADWLFNYRITTATAKGVEGFPFDLNQTVLPLYNVTYTK